MPLNQRGLQHSPVGVTDSLSLTFGATFAFRERFELNAGVGIPMTGPEPFETDAIVQLNVRF